MTFLDEYRGALSLPLIAAPMFLVSGPDLVIAACANGVLGSFPCANARTLDMLNAWIAQITERLGGRSSAPWAANLVVHPTNPRLSDELSALENVHAPVVITALGGPKPIVERVHAWGGKVFADVNSVTFAKKAADAGVDGLILVSAGAGGHTGRMNGFSLLSAVREFFDGPIALGGGLSNGGEIRAVETAGADMAVMGTAFIATEESLAAPEYKNMLIDSTIDDLVLTNAVTNVLANWLRPTLVRAGIDPTDFLVNPRVDFSDSSLIDKQRARWKTVWSAGHGVGSVRRVDTVADLIARLKREYLQACDFPRHYG